MPILLLSSTCKRVKKFLIYTSFMRFIKQFYPLDLFQRPVYLYFNNKDRFSSRTGLFLSAIIYAVIIYTVSKSDIFAKNYPRIFNEQVSFGIRPQLHLEDNIFALSLTDNIGTHYSDPTIFSINVKNLYFKTNLIEGTGLALIYSDEKALDYCNKVAYNQESIKVLALGSFFCMKNDSFTVEGFFDEPYIKMLSITVEMCNNETMNNSCKSREEISRFLKGKKFNFIYSDNSLDLKNYQTPINRRLRNDYQLLNSKVTKILNVYLKKVGVMTDDGLIGPNLNNIETFVVDSRETDFDFAYDSSEGVKTFFTLNFFSASKTQRIERYYQNVSDLFSTLGGLLNSLILIGFSLSYLEKSLYLTKKIMNRLYTFQPEKRKTREITMTNSETNRINENKNEEKTATQQMNPIILPSIEELKSENMLFMNKSHEMDSSKNYNQNMEEKIRFEKKISRIIENVQESQIYEPKKSCSIEMEIKKEEGDSPEKIIDTPERKKEEEEEDKSKDNSPDKTVQTNSQVDRTEGKEKSWFNLGRIRKKFRDFTKKNGLKRETVQHLEKFQDFQDSKNKISISLMSYIKLQFSRIFCCKKSFNERLFLKAEHVFSQELDIVTILRKLQEIEKLKMVLLNEKQLILFNVLAKPLVYLDKEKLNKLAGSYTIAEVLSSKLKNRGLKDTVNFYENKENARAFTEVDKRLMKMLDNNLKDFMNYFQEE